MKTKQKKIFEKNIDKSLKKICKNDFEDIKNN